MSSARNIWEIFAGQPLEHARVIGRVFFALGTLPVVGGAASPTALLGWLER